jgi:hypothetical protein
MLYNQYIAWNVENIKFITSEVFAVHARKAYKWRRGMEKFRIIRIALNEVIGVTHGDMC